MFALPNVGVYVPYFTHSRPLPGADEASANGKPGKLHPQRGERSVARYGGGQRDIGERTEEPHQLRRPRDVLAAQLLAVKRGASGRARPRTR
ncbi:hypothetical protein MRX96_023108 [Rhipicephalus microplus]